MKRLYTILTACLLLAACESEEMGQEAVGYLTLAVGTDKTTLTKAEDEYNPKQIAVKIVNSAGKIVEETEDWTTWTEPIKLPVGTYTIDASSAGFDGETAGWDKPYYAAKETIDIKMNTTTEKDIVCKLANVMVTVEFSDDFRAAFQSAVVGVLDKSNSDNKVTFEMRQASETGKAYFPVTDLISNLAVTNYKGELHSKKDTITGIKAQENVILRYRIVSSGSSNIQVSVDDATKTYTYMIGVPITATNTLIASANAWSSFAYLTGEVPSFTDIFDQSKLEFQYKTAEAGEWIKVPTEITVEEKDKKFSTKLIGLTPSTAYQCRLYYNDGSEEGITSEAVDFTTEAQTPLPNGNLDSWYQSGKTWYPVTENDYNVSGSFWDSSNPGTTTGAGALVNKNPTQGNSTTVHTSGGQSAELKSQYASAFGIGKFAAASLYTGKFNSLVGTNGAKIDFGQPFVSRPTALHGWFHYTSGKIDYRGNNTPEGLGEKGSDDLCSIYIALSKKQKQVNNTDTSTFLDLENDTDIIAYGRLDDTEAVTTNVWKEFTLNFKYKTLEPLDTYYLIIVFSASKYGDYFTGSTSSVMYVDDLELIYGDEPVLSE